MKLSHFINKITTNNDFEFSIRFPIDTFIGIDIKPCVQIIAEKDDVVMNTGFPIDMIDTMTDENIESLVKLFQDNYNQKHFEKTNGKQPIKYND